MTASPALRPTGSSRLSRITDGALRFVGLIATPLVAADYIDMVSPLRAGAELRARIVAKRPEAGDAATIVLKPGRGWRRHRPGQYVRLGVSVNGVRYWRAYSLTSLLDDDHIAITVKARPDGLVSRYLVHDAPLGLLVMLDQATGEFTLPEPAPSRLLFVAAGSGITPIMGMIRNLPALDLDVVVLHCAPTADDMIFGDDLRALHAGRRLRLVEHHTARSGYLAFADLDELVPDWRRRETYVCGPTGLLDTAETHWREAHLDDLLHTERFRPSILAVGEGGAATFTASGLTVETDGTRPLLDDGEAAGVIMPSGCRMGICFRCVAPLTQGAVRDLRNGDLTTVEDGERVLVQTCVSAAAGSCHIDL